MLSLGRWCSIVSSTWIPNSGIKGINDSLSSCLLQELLRLWKHECKRVIADRFTASDDVTWFDKALVSLVEEEFGEEKKLLVDCGSDIYFVDFLRDAPEATGEL